MNFIQWILTGKIALSSPRHKNCKKNFISKWDHKCAQTTITISISLSHWRLLNISWLCLFFFKSLTPSFLVNVSSSKSAKSIKNHFSYSSPPTYLKTPLNYILSWSISSKMNIQKLNSLMINIYPTYVKINYMKSIGISLPCEELSLPNPWNIKASGIIIHRIPTTIDSDNPSGNVLKQWNKHISFYLTVSGLPPGLKNQEYNCHFLSTSNRAGVLEISSQIVKECLSNFIFLIDLHFNFNLHFVWWVRVDCIFLFLSFYKVK